MEGKPGGKWYSYALRENAFGVATQLATFAAGVAFTVVFPNLLGKAGFGKLSLVLAVAYISLSLASIGVSSAILRFVPLGVKQRNPGDYLLWLLKVNILLGAVLSLFLFLGANLIASSLFSLPEIAAGVQMAALFVLAGSLFSFVDSSLVSLKRTNISLLINSAYQAGRVLIPIALYLWLGDYAWIVVGMALAYILPFALGLAFLGKEGAVSLHGGRPIDSGALRGYLAFGSVGLIAGLIIQWSDTLVVGAFGTPEDVAIYRVAWLWAMSVVFLIPFSARIMTSMHAYESAERSRKVVDAALKYAFAFIFLILAGTLAVSDRFLVVVYGEGYAAAYPLLVALSLVVVEITLTSLATPLLTGKGDAKTPSYISLAYSLALAVCAYAAAALGMGLIGVAVAAALVRLLGGIWMTAVALERIKLRIPAIYVLKPAAAALVSVVLTLAIGTRLGAGLVPAVALGALVVASFGAVSVLVGAIDLKEMRRLAKAVL